MIAQFHSYWQGTRKNPNPLGLGVRQSGIERICERVAVTLDGELPTDEQWHRTLLYQMGQSRDDRPPLFSQNLLSDTDEYRRFRHRLRHIYGYELEPARVVALAQKAISLSEDIREAVMAFCDWLEDSKP